MGEEDYRKRAAEKLQSVLEACCWQRSRNNNDLIWEKNQYGILVDDLGIFVYRRTGQQWERVAGLAHYLIRPLDLRSRTIFLGNGLKIDLLKGE